MLFFVCLHRLFNHMCSKCLPLSHTHALSGARDCKVNGCVNLCIVQLKGMTNATNKNRNNAI